MGRKPKGKSGFRIYHHTTPVLSHSPAERDPSSLPIFKTLTPNLKRKVGRKPKLRRHSFPPSTGAAALFTVGSEVEVRSNDDGFRGAWFEATVVVNLAKYRRCTVSYSSLLSDDNPNVPLEETVNYSFVRPRPPRPSAGSHFALHQPVDAYHNEGWWAGVISELPGGGVDRYSVCFPNTREEYGFKPSEIRPQVKWVKGCWVSIEDEDRADVMFTVGTPVEVSRDRENYGAAWFVGTVLKVIGTCNFLVEYESLRVDGDGSSGMLLKELVDLQYIRPPPPALESKNFDLSDEVEAFHQGGWLAGVVSEILPGSRYIVKSKQLEGEMEFDSTLLRPHREWTDGKWVRISQDNRGGAPTLRRTKFTVRRRKSNVGKKPSFPIAVSTSSDDCGDDADESDSMKRKAEKEISSQASKKSKKGKLLKPLKLLDGSLIECGSKTPMKEKHSPTATPVPEESPAWMSEQHHFKSPSHVNAGKELPSWQSSKGARSPRENTKSRRKKLVIRAPHRQRSAPDAVDEKRHAQEEMENRKRVHNSITGVEHKHFDGRTGLEAEGDNRRDEVERSIVPLSSCVTPDILSPSHHDKLMEGQKSLLIFNIEGNSKADNVISIYWSNKQVDILEDGYLTPQTGPSARLAKLVNCSTIQQLPDDILSSFNNRVGEIQNCGNGLDEVGAEVGCQVLPSLSEDDNEHQNPPPTGSPSETITVTEESLVHNSASKSLSSKSIAPPFSKKSSLWKYIESEEVFRSMLQQPHFHQLEHYDVEFREGMAIGLMVTFANLAADISKLCIDDSKQTFEEKLKSLLSLEKNGFDVQPLRARLQRLLEIRSTLSQVESKKVALKEKLLEREGVKDRADALITAFDRVIADLEENLTRFREKKASKILEMRSNESEVFKLKMGVQAAEEAFLSAKQQFDSVLTAPW